jgi:integrase
MRAKSDNVVIIDKITLTQEEELSRLSPYMMFKYNIRSEITRKYYERRLRGFFDYTQFETGVKEMEKRCNDFAEYGRSNISWILNQVIRFLQFQKQRVENEEITAATLKNFVKSLKVFCDSADLDIPWKKVTRGLPKGRQSANDRAPTIEEIRKLVEYPDRRIKPIVYTMVSSGIRLGSWDFLQWKHVEPITKENGKIIAAKLRVYAGDTEEYYSFITTESYNALKEWIEFRISYGEKITGSSWVMRDLWQTTNMNYGARWGLATNPKKLKSSGIKRLLERALWEQGIRQPLMKNEKRHEWKAAHGLRKFYKSRTEQVMKPINIELTMGHDIGVSASYYKPREHEVLEDYLKATDLLTINSDSKLLQKQVEELKEKSTDNEYIIKGKLREKDEQIQGLVKKQEKFEQLIQTLIDSGQLKPASPTGAIVS